MIGFTRVRPGRFARHGQRVERARARQHNRRARHLPFEDRWPLAGLGLECLSQLPRGEGIVFARRGCESNRESGERQHSFAIADLLRPRHGRAVFGERGAAKGRNKDQSCRKFDLAHAGHFFHLPIPNFVNQKHRQVPPGGDL